MCEYLKSLGFQILDCDAYVKKIYSSSHEILFEIQKNFGQDIVENGVLNRKLLAERAFKGEKNTRLLNSIVHPAVISLCEKDARHPCVLDAPLLFEAKANEKCFKTIAVTANEDVRLKRIMKRDSISDGEARLRMSAQKDEAFYTENADFTIINNGSENIAEQINNILQQII